MVLEEVDFKASPVETFWAVSLKSPAFFLLAADSLLLDLILIGYISSL